MVLTCLKMDIRGFMSGIVAFVLMKYPSSSCLDISILPSTVCYQEHQNIVLRCVFGDQNTSNAKFKFKPRDRPDTVQELNSIVVKSDTIEARISDVTIPDNIGTYFCTRDGYSKRQITYIEERVVLPDQVQCYFDESRMSVICDWIGGNTTCWNLSIVNAGMGAYVTEQTCNVSTTCNELSPLAHCVQAKSETKTKMNAVCPVSSPGKKAIDLKLTGVKLTSTASKIIHKSIDCSTVKLSVNGVHVQNNSSIHSVLAWRTTGSLQENCDCQIQCAITTNKSTPIKVTQKCSADNQFTVNLKNLQETMTYTSVIACHVIGSEVWSDEVVVKFTTSFTAPFNGPLVGPGGYNMYACHKRFYCLVLYWKVLEEKVSRFKILVSYRTQKFEYEVPNSSVGKLRIPKTGSCQQFTISIYSVNTVGISKNATFLQAVDRFCGERHPISCTIRHSNNSRGYSGSASVNTPCMRNQSCDVTYYWCQGTKYDSYVECQNFVKWTKVKQDVSATEIPIHQSKANSSVYIGVAVSHDGQSVGIDWDVCQESTANQANSRTTRKSYIVIVIPIVVVLTVLTLFGIFLTRRGGLREKLWNILKKSSRKNAPIADYQGDHPTQKGNSNDRRRSDPLPQSVEGYYESTDSSIYHSIPLAILSTEKSNPNLNPESYIPVSDLDQMSQTLPKNVCSITLEANTSDGMQTEDCNSETERKVATDYYSKVDDSGISETFKKEREDTESSQIAQNLDYTWTMEHSSEEYVPSVSMCSNRSIHFEEFNSQQQIADEFSDIQMKNQNENKQVDLNSLPCVQSTSTGKEDADKANPVNNHNISKDVSSEKYGKSNITSSLQNESSSCGDECNDYVKAEGPVINDLTINYYGYVPT